MFVLAGLLALAACQSTNLGVDSRTDLNTQPGTATPTASASGEIVGNGPVRVALLLPRTAPGNAAAVANELRNGALMALTDFGRDTIQIVIKDTAGQAATAQATATEAMSEGSSAVLGPVFSADVGAASAITLPAGRTMIAFSTDSTVARRGVYLLSFTPQDDTRRAVSFALSQGRRSFAAFLPNNSEGTLREAVFRQLVGAAGGNVQVIKYDRSAPSIEQAVDRVAGFIASVDTIYIPEGNEMPNAILQEFRKKGVDIVGKLILGSGSWETVKLSDPMLDGAVYPGRELTNFAPFAQRYEAEHGARPGVWAGMGYDAVTLAIKLVQQNGPEAAFRPESVENPRGFAGINGIFRLRSDGIAERGLAIYQVANGEGQLLSPAPTTFARSGS
ncbi:MAG: penicillin-binding protein activator [Alphaproteobacteria bacterium]|nr:MAG: penicillin-binding protein activator [Alphaproteobacteria bacterium]